MENLEASQRFPLIAWARFDLGYTTVLLHDIFLLPPLLSEGDEVVVVGMYEENRFSALACYKAAESDEEHGRRKRAEDRRKRIWVSLMAVLVVIPWLWVLVRSPAAAFSAAPLLMSPLAVWSFKNAELWAAEAELALTLAEEGAAPDDAAAPGAAAERS